MFEHPKNRLEPPISRLLGTSRSRIEATIEDDLCEEMEADMFYETKSKVNNNDFIFMLDVEQDNEYDYRNLGDINKCATK